MKIIGIQSLNRGPKANAWARSGQALTFSLCNLIMGRMGKISGARNAIAEIGSVVTSYIIVILLMSLLYSFI